MTAVCQYVSGGKRDACRVEFVPSHAVRMGTRRFDLRQRCWLEQPFDLSWFRHTTRRAVVTTHNGRLSAMVAPRNLQCDGDFVSNGAGRKRVRRRPRIGFPWSTNTSGADDAVHASTGADAARRSEEHTSELQLRQYLVCRLL